MIESNVDLGDTNRIQKALSKLPKILQTKFAKKATYLVAQAIKGIIQPYPGPPHRPVIWSSARQRRAYFARRRAAGLPLKYTRGNDPMSERMQQSWTVRSRTRSAILGNRASYAPYVAAKQLQTAQHAATGFVTDEEAIDRAKRSGTVGRITKAELKKVVREAFRG